MKVTRVTPRLARTNKAPSKPEAPTQPHPDVEFLGRHPHPAYSLAHVEIRTTQDGRLLLSIADADWDQLREGLEGDIQDWVRDYSLFTLEEIQAAAEAEIAELFADRMNDQAEGLRALMSLLTTMHEAEVCRRGRRGVLLTPAQVRTLIPRVESWVDLYRDQGDQPGYQRYRKLSRQLERYDFSFKAPRRAIRGATRMEGEAVS